MNNIDNNQTIEIFAENNQKNIKEKEFITPLRTNDLTSFTKVTPLEKINDKTKSEIRFEINQNENDENDFILPNVEEINRELEPITNDVQIIPRPPPLLALSQAIRTKHPEQLIDSKLNNQLPSIKDLPYSLANYSFVFYGFSST